MSTTINSNCLEILKKDTLKTNTTTFIFHHIFYKDLKIPNALKKKNPGPLPC